MSKDARPYHVLLIFDDSLKKLNNTWAVAQDACDYGMMMAGQLYPGCTVEVVVVHTMSGNAVINDFMAPEPLVFPRKAPTV